MCEYTQNISIQKTCNSLVGIFTCRIYFVASSEYLLHFRRVDRVYGSCNDRFSWFHVYKGTFDKLLNDKVHVQVLLLEGQADSWLWIWRHLYMNNGWLFLKNVILWRVKVKLISIDCGAISGCSRSMFDYIDKHKIKMKLYVWIHFEI